MLKEVQFVDDEHEKFFLDNIVRCRYEEVYHHTLIYCLGISETTRRNIDSIYDFATGCIKTECLCEDWQTSGSIRIVRLAFCLYCDGTLSVNKSSCLKKPVFMRVSAISISLLITN